MTEMLGYIACNFFGHTDTETSIRFDIPFAPGLIDDECLREGFVCLEWETCTRCGELVNSEPVPVTEERREEYYDWFEGQWGIRP